MIDDRIMPISNITGTSKTGVLLDISANKISNILGFDPNVDDDPNKVVNSWGFTYDGIKCAIWDYKGSQFFGQFSTFGPRIVFDKLFGDHYV